MLKPFARMKLRSRIGGENAKREKRFIPWGNIRNMALILSAEDKVIKNRIDRYIDATGKHVEVYYVELASRKPSYADWHCFCSKDSSMLMLPVKKLQKQLKSRRYDLVLNAAEGLFAASLAVMLMAPFKCTDEDVLGYADLVIRRSGTMDIADYLAEVERYLKMIRS